MLFSHKMIHLVWEILITRMGRDKDLWYILLRISLLLQDAEEAYSKPAVLFLKPKQKIKVNCVLSWVPAVTSSFFLH
jgi:hypothetical protein